jgi:hypothetical protein
VLHATLVVPEQTTVPEHPLLEHAPPTEPESVLHPPQAFSDLLQAPLHWMVPLQTHVSP